MTCLRWSMGMAKNYETLIFDLGGVLYHIDINHTINAFKNLGLMHFEKIYNLSEQTLLIDQFERGEIDGEGFLTGLQPHFHNVVDAADVIDAWNAMLLGMPQPSLDALQELAQDYTLILLSNTNEFHIEHLNKELQHNYKIDGLQQLFDHVIYSYKVGMRKPEEDIFEHALELAGDDPADILFIEDSAKNAEAAAKLGINTHVMPRNGDLREELRKLGLFN